MGLVKKEKKNPTGPKCHKKSLKRGLKIKPKQPNTIWPKLNPIIAYPL